MTIEAPPPQRLPPPIPEAYRKPGGRQPSRRTLGIIIGCLSLLLLAGAGLALRSPSPQSLARTTAESVVIVRSTRPDGEMTGSGFFVTDSTIVTNHHVIEGATSISVERHDGQLINNVRLLRDQDGRDLALLGVPPTGTPLRLRGGDGVEQGATIYALGHPEGLSFSFSSGIVSSRREVAGTQVLQITAPVSHGSSGGPVIDATGRVVGVTTSQLREGQNLNFAVSVRYVRDLLNAADGREAVPVQEAGARRLGSLLDSGSYILTYEIAQPDSMTLLIEAAADTLVGVIGPAAAWKAPRVKVSGVFPRDLPASFEYGRPEYQFVIDSVASRRLFSGHFTLYGNGKSSSVAFTAARRARLLAGESRVLIDAGERGGLAPSGFRSSDGVALSAQITWTDAGAQTAIGVIRRNSIPGSPKEPLDSWGDTAWAQVRGDSVHVQLGKHMCRFPVADWPAANGRCWTETDWYGASFANATDDAVNRGAVTHLPFDFAGVFEARSTAGGPYELIYATADLDSGPSSARGSEHAYRAWRVPLESTGDAPKSEPWPTSVAPYELSHSEQGDAALLDSAHLVIHSAERWDTVAVPNALVSLHSEAPPHDVVKAVGDHRFLVMYANGYACWMWLAGEKLSESQNEANSCRRPVGMIYDHSSRTWGKLLRGPEFSHSFAGIVAALAEGRALYEVISADGVKSGGVDHYFALDSSGFHPIAGPLPDSMQSRVQVIYPTENGSSIVAVAFYCPRASRRCSDDRSIHRFLVRWSPGNAPRILRVDSTGAFQGISLRRSDAGRVFVVSEDAIRLADDWSVAVRKPHFAGDIRSLLEDRANNSVVVVSSLGEWARIALPAPSSSGAGSNWDRVSMWIHRRFGMKH